MTRRRRDEYDEDWSWGGISYVSIKFIENGKEHLFIYVYEMD